MLVTYASAVALRSIQLSALNRRRMKQDWMIRYPALLCVALMLAAWGAEHTATPHLVATQIAVQEAAMQLDPDA